MIKTNDTTYNIAKSVKCFVIKSHLSFFFFLKEDKVAFNEKKTYGYLKIFIHHYKNMFYIFKKENKHQRNYMTFREM